TAALKINRKEVTARLLKKVYEYYDIHDDEAVLAIGNILLEAKQDDCNFLNTIGNSTRRLMDYQKANDIYRNVLRKDRSFVKALYNLAASMAKVEKFDSEAIKAVTQFDKIKGYVLPDYCNDPDIVDKIIKQMNKESDDQAERIQSLITEKETELANKNIKAVKELIHKIEMEEKTSYKPTYTAVCKRLKQAIKKNWNRQTIDESIIVLQENRFNLGLFALSREDSSLALECFKKLKLEKCSIENLDLLLALTIDHKGDTSNAIEALKILLSKNPNNRLLNLNLGLLYRKTGNQLLSYMYLLKAASQLEKSEGLFSISDIQKRADEYFENGLYEKALRLFKLVSEEIPTIHVWMRIGEILIKQEEYIEAIMAFHEVQAIDRQYKSAEKKLKIIQDRYCDLAEHHYRKLEYFESSTYIEKALELFRTPTVISKAVNIYGKLDDQSRVKKLLKEIEHLKRKETERGQEKERQECIQKGKDFMKEKDFNNAILYFEKAFEMKADKDVFVFLAHIFKGLNQSRKLSTLMRRWRVLMEREVNSEGFDD
ncbi:hypothetical protein KKA14_12045, partial [bacterium]|nr:hypothetical protein [bacterium]